MIRLSFTYTNVSVLVSATAKVHAYLRTNLISAN